MQKDAAQSGYPLSPELTDRVISYLNGFRLFIAFVLGAAWFRGFLILGDTITSATFAAALLITYLIFSIYFIYQSLSKAEDPYSVAQKSLLLDVILISFLMYTFEGLGVLLVFVGASAGILLPLRNALFIAALAAIAFVSLPLITGQLESAQTRSLLQGGLYGLTVFVITTLTHVLACWARDLRLIAERQMVALTRLEQINEMVIKRLRSGVLAVDRNNQIKMMNESAWFLLGSPAASDRGLAEISPELNEFLDQWTEEPGLDQGVLRLTSSQAEVIPQFISLPGSNEVTTVIFLEDNDIVARRALEMSSISLAKLSTSIAHEIRNPLAAISHSAQLLAEDPELDPSLARLAEIITNQSFRVNRIIENILQMSRREKSQHELIDLPLWMRDIADEFSNANPDRQFEVIIDEADNGTLIMFDRSQLHQVIWKLMDNAMQHTGTEESEAELALRLVSDSDAGFCVISIEDNGNGIPQEHIANIFEPFYTTHKEGTGLGLYIARQLCEANQAELTVDSKPGGKTRFHIRIAHAGSNSNKAPDLTSFRTN